MLVAGFELAQHPTLKYDERLISDIKYLVVHHVGAEQTGTPLEIAKATALYHVNSNGWPGIAYHYMIAKDGTIVFCQGWTTVSYHVASRNKECLGICLQGDLSQHPPTEAQRLSLKDLLAWLKQELPETSITTHKQIALPAYPTSCPGTYFTF